MESKAARYPRIMVFFGIFVTIYSIYLIFSAFENLQKGNTEEFSYNLIIGVIGIVLATTSIFLLRKRASMTKPPPKVLTVINCSNCGFKLVRQFQEGDYVNKEVGDCQQCKGKMNITAIYAESEQKIPA